MVLTFTGSLRVAEAGENEIHTMLVGAIGCNVAWGVIDAVLYLMGCLADKGRSLQAFLAARTEDPKNARRIIAGILPPLIASLLQSAELESIRQRLIEVPDQPQHARISGEDMRGALGVFLLVFLSTFPVVIPFIVMSDAKLAINWSNGIAIGLLFITGYAFGKMSARSPIGTGVVMVVLGFALVLMTMALGG
jgi:VIT1/CCC1 family predicted Fe2+/Mn2+ transporter